MNPLKAIVAIVLITPVLMYIFNPFGTSTGDPRGRVLGVIPYRIPSGAMAPTLQSGDFILVNATAYMNGLPEINDVIVFNYPEDTDIDFVMRVIGTPNDKIEIKQGDILVNGVKIEQPYIDPENSVRTSQTDLFIDVPENSLFVLGDNRDNSRDSRYWGFVPTDYVVGKVSLIWSSKDDDRIGKVR